MLIWTDGGSKTVWRVYWPTVKFCRSDANNDDWHRQTGSLQRGEEETDESVTDDLIVTRPERKEKTEKTKLYRYLVSVLFTKHLKNEIIGSKHVVEVLSLSAPPFPSPPTWQTWPWLSDIKLNNSSIFFSRPNLLSKLSRPGEPGPSFHHTYSDLGVRLSALRRSDGLPTLPWHTVCVTICSESVWCVRLFLQHLLERRVGGNVIPVNNIGDMRDNQQPWLQPLTAYKSHACVVCVWDYVRWQRGVLGRQKASGVSWLVWVRCRPQAVEEWMILSTYLSSRFFFFLHLYSYFSCSLISATFISLYHLPLLLWEKKKKLAAVHWRFCFVFHTLTSIWSVKGRGWRGLTGRWAYNRLSEGPLCMVCVSKIF